MNPGFPRVTSDSCEDSFHNGRFPWLTAGCRGKNMRHREFPCELPLSPRVLWVPVVPAEVRGHSRGIPQNTVGVVQGSREFLGFASVGSCCSHGSVWGFEPKTVGTIYTCIPSGFLCAPAVPTGVRREPIGKARNIVGIACFCGGLKLVPTVPTGARRDSHGKP